MLNKLCAWTAKIRAVPSLHRDSFLSKVPGLCPVLRQVTLTNYTAGPLGLACALNDNDRKTEVNAVIKMEEGPPQVSYRRNLQTTLRCFTGNWAVLNS
jgi:hypothetical protein